MTDLRTAAMQALEALEGGEVLCEVTAANILRTALEQPMCKKHPRYSTYPLCPDCELEKEKSRRDAALEQPVVSHTQDTKPVVSQKTGDLIDKLEQRQDPVGTLTIRDDMGADFRFKQPFTLIPGTIFALYAASVDQRQEPLVMPCICQFPPDGGCGAPCEYAAPVEQPK